MKRIHELLLNEGDAQSYNRLGISYVDGDPTATLVYPDSQYSEQTSVLTYAQVEELLEYLADIKHLMDKKRKGDAS